MPNSNLKESDWLFPKGVNTPQDQESLPILYKVFKIQEDIKKDVTMMVYVDQLAKVMKDLEQRLSNFD